MNFIRHCLRSARAALQWRLLLLWTGLLLLPTLAIALPFWVLFGAAFDHSVHAAALAQQLDLSTIADLMVEQARNPLAPRLGAATAVVLTLLLSPLLTGAVITAARAMRPAPSSNPDRSAHAETDTPGTAGAPPFNVLLAGAMAEYPRMFRMLLWSVIPLGAALGAGSGLMKLANRHADKAILPTDGQYGRWAAAALAALLLALTLATLDAGRAALAADRRRSSAVKAWWRGLLLLRHHPLAALGSYLLISLAGLLIAAALGLARINLPHVSLPGFLLALLLTQIIAVVLAWMRGARLFAMITVAQAAIVNKN
jgi:hypothetical protein